MVWILQVLITDINMLIRDKSKPKENQKKKAYSKKKIFFLTLNFCSTPVKLYRTWHKVHDNQNKNNVHLL